VAGGALRLMEDAGGLGLGPPVSKPGHHPRRDDTTIPATISANAAPW